MNLPLSSVFLLCMVLGGFVVSLLLITCMLKRFQQNSGQLLDPLIIQGDFLVVNTLAHQPTYRLQDIDAVHFFLMRNRSWFVGKFQIVPIGGKPSRKFIFDGSAHTRRMQLTSSREDVLLAIEAMQAQLTAHGIRCDVQVLA